jgi:hypothetical protein
VIVANPIDVIQVEHQRTASPFADTTFMALSPQEPRSDETTLKAIGIGVVAALDKDRFQRHPFLHGTGCAPPMGLSEPVRCVEPVSCHLSMHPPVMRARNGHIQ